MTPPRVVLALSLASLAFAAPAAAQADFTAAIDAAQARVVKLYGGTFGASVGYGSGIIASADGEIITVLGALVEASNLRVVLADGRRFPAKVVARDARRQLALLRIEADGLAYFDITGSEHLRSGDWVIAAANPFRVADGPEPVSVSAGVLAGRATLSARRKAQDFPYDGAVLLTDAIVSTPGSAGGALVDCEGRLVGVIGKMVESTLTNTFANYALPAEEVAAFLSDARSGKAPGGDAHAALPQPADGAARLRELGVTLLDVGGRIRPAYVERVRPRSIADEAGVRAGDLVIALDGRPIGSCDELYAAVAALSADSALSLSLKRGDEVKQLHISPEALP